MDNQLPHFFRNEKSCLFCSAVYKNNKNYLKTVGALKLCLTNRTFSKYASNFFEHNEQWLSKQILLSWQLA